MTKAVQQERRLVREHAGLAGPEPERDVLVLGRERIVAQPVDDSADAIDSAPAVVVQQRSGEASLQSFSQREVAGLRSSGFVQGIPVGGWAIGLRTRHA